MNTFTLKMIALVLMVIDHIGFYFEGAPIWFRYLGRGSYPLFLFCMVWGYHYTSDRKKYLLRLYLMSVFMTLLIYFIDTYLKTDGGFGNHNIFLSLFLVGIIISTIELFQKDQKKGSLMLALIFLVQVLYYIAQSTIPFFRYYVNGDFLTGIIPNLALNEYGSLFLILGVLMYFLKEKKELFCAMYILFCIGQYSTEKLVGDWAVQFFMILALPLMLLYNNQRGYRLKYFFYIFYPAHAFVLFYISNFLLTGK